MDYDDSALSEHLHPGTDREGENVSYKLSRYMWHSDSNFDADSTYLMVVRYLSMSTIKFRFLS